MREYRERDRRHGPLGLPGGDVDRFGARAFEALSLFVGDTVACLDRNG